MASKKKRENIYDKSQMDIVSIMKFQKERVKIEKVEDYYRIFQNMLKSEDSVFHSIEHFWILGIDKFGYSTCAYIVALGTKEMGYVNCIRYF